MAGYILVKLMLYQNLEDILIRQNRNKKAYNLFHFIKIFRILHSIRTYIIVPISEEGIGFLKYRHTYKKDISDLFSVNV